MVYGPGAEHAAINRPCLCFTFVITDLDHLHHAATVADVPFDPARHGDVVEFRPSEGTRALGGALDTYTAGAVSGSSRSAHADDLLLSFAHLLRLEADSGSIGRGKGMDSRQIVTSCVDFAVATDRIPSISEMCLAVHVSERRRRHAFVEEFDLPPSRCFRAWALDEAHRRLRAADPADCTVTTIEAGLGFDHLAGHYKDVFDEYRSTTLESPAS